MAWLLAVDVGEDLTWGCDWADQTRRCDCVVVSGHLIDVEAMGRGERHPTTVRAVAPQLDEHDSVLPVHLGCVGDHGVVDDVASEGVARDAAHHSGLATAHPDDGRGLVPRSGQEHSPHHNNLDHGQGRDDRPLPARHPSDRQVQAVR